MSRDSLRHLSIPGFVSLHEVRWKRSRFRHSLRQSLLSIPYFLLFNQSVMWLMEGFPAIAGDATPVCIPVCVGI